MKRISFFHEDKLFLAVLLYRMDVISWLSRKKVWKFS